MFKSRKDTIDGPEFKYQCLNKREFKCPALFKI